MLRRNFLSTLTAAPVLLNLPSARAAMRQNTPDAAAEKLAAFRAQFAKTPVQTAPITSDLSLLSGPGGNMAVLNTSQGKLLVDSGTKGAEDHIREALTGIGPAPLKTLINTHFHFDHTDGNAPLHPGARIIAHKNTKLRLSSTQYIKVVDITVPAAPASALPDETITSSRNLSFHGKPVHLIPVKPAHTDTDLFVHFPAENVLHVGDIWFNGFYPLIDYSSGGSIAGMIAAADEALKMANGETKIIPGHGPLGDKTSLQEYRDMLATVRDRVAKLKAEGRTSAEVAAAAPLADLDGKWGKGSFTGPQFAEIAYQTL